MASFSIHLEAEVSNVTRSYCIDSAVVSAIHFCVVRCVGYNLLCNTSQVVFAVVAFGVLVVCCVLLLFASLRRVRVLVADFLQTVQSDAEDGLYLGVTKAC